MFSQWTDRRLIPCAETMYDALQDLRIKQLLGSDGDDNRMRALYMRKGLEYKSEILSCGDTLSISLARWQVTCGKPNDLTESQAERAKCPILSISDMKEFYYLALRLVNIFGL